MRTIRGIKIGGLQQKIFNLMLLIIVAMVAAFGAVSAHQQQSLATVVEQAGAEQQAAITGVSEATMEAVLQSTMTRTTALQAYIASDLFGEVKTDVMTLQAYATVLFEHPDRYPGHPFFPPDKRNDGIPSVQIQHEAGVDPDQSEALGLAAHMSEVMLSMFTNSDKLNSCFVATADGCILYVDDRAGSYFDENGQVVIFDVRSRPWYKQAAEAGKLIFTGVELDAFTDIAGLVCAAPVYRDGELAAVVGADIFLTSISEYVGSTAADSSFLCVVNQNGQVLFSPKQEGAFMANISADAEDLRKGRNAELAAFVQEALLGNTGLELITADGKAYYMSGAPIGTLGWTVISAVEAELTRQPTEAMLARYDEINQNAAAVFQKNAGNSRSTLIVLIAAVFVLAVAGALAVAGRIVKPLEHMTRRIGSLSGKDSAFEMEKIYRTNDEIEILAQSFAELSERTRNYITRITEITAEKERIGTELALATRIQADMLPNIYPAFPERSEFDIYATMDPAREVGGDFYDFFLVDDDHLCMMIADVSGKGIPAALFMMASRIILASNAKAGKSPAEILTAANDTICQNNREEMFVTVWLGILEISTGKVRAANAGHEYPVMMQAGGRFELVKDRHGFVIGGMNGVKYREYELQLTPGSRLFLYTDGVPEATNAEEALFGTERMLAALNQDTKASPEQMLRNVQSAVDAFVQDAEQFDDLTMLGFVFRGKEASAEG